MSDSNKDVGQYALITKSLLLCQPQSRTTGVKTEANEPIAQHMKIEVLIEREVEPKVVVKTEPLSPNSEAVENAKFKPPTADRPEQTQTDRKEIQLHRVNIREVLLSSNATPIRTHTDKGYVCCYCDQAYLAPADLKQHTLQAHKNVTDAYFMKKLRMFMYVIKLDITGLHCSICEININSLEELTHHLKTEHNKTIHTDINNHIMPFKFDTESLQCYMCKHVFDKFKMLLEHMSVHYRNYTCDVCNTGFVTHGAYTMHALTHKTGSFTCEHCSKHFDTNVKLKKHVRTRHSGVVYKCVYCTESFATYRNREAHLTGVHGMPGRAPTKCQECDKVFQHKGELRSHVKRVHLMDRPHECSICKMKFFKSQELKFHLLKHSEVKAHQCAVCSKFFKMKKSLTEHMRIHNDDRRFKCEHCGKAFVQKHSLMVHLRSKHSKHM